MYHSRYYRSRVSELFVTLIVLQAFCLFGVDFAPQVLAKSTTSVQKIPYGNNPDAGKFLRVNNISMYVETYGSGPPLLLLHSNGGSIQQMFCQIDHFAKEYTVIAIDSRGHGKSEMGCEHLTHEQMADDVNVLLEQLDLKSVRILGWSDGGVIGLLLSLKHSDKVNKLAIMGANIRSDAAYDWSIVLAKKELSRINSKIAEDDQSEPWENMRQHILLLFEDPNIPTENLKKIKTPTLVMAGDEDVIRHEHTLEIYHALPNAHLCIFPGSTHGAPITDSQLFNQITDHFFREPFKRPTTRAFYEKHF